MIGSNARRLPTLTPKMILILAEGVTYRKVATVAY